VGKHGRLECLAGLLPRHLLRCEGAQFGIDQREKLPGRIRIAALHPPQDKGDVAHARQVPDACSEVTRVSRGEVQVAPPENSLRDPLN
jgi:hypothetical protein